MSRRSIKNLEKEARARASKLSGVLALLLTLQEGKIGRVSFDRTTATFIVDGRRLSARQLRYQLGLLENRLAKTMQEYSKNLETGRWTLAKWQEEMQALLETSHLWFAALALGTVAAATIDKTVQRRIERDLKYLDGFVRDIRTGKIKGPKIAARSRSYLRSIYVTYGLLTHRLHIALGYTEAMRILTAKESCVRNEEKLGCIDVGFRWMPIRDMPPIGTLVCGQFCKCYLEFRR